MAASAGSGAGAAAPATSGNLEGIVGLSNLGNSCYINAVIQVLTHIPEAFEGITYRSSTMGQLLRNIVSDKWNANVSRTYSGRYMIPSINLGVGEALGYNGEQQDAHQTYMAFVDALRFGDNDGVHKDKQLKPEAAAFDRELCCEYLRTTECHTCRTKSTVTTGEYLLNLPIDPAAEAVTVDAAFNDLAPEMLEGDEQYECDVCGARSNATRTTTWARYPKHIVIGVKRFVWGASGIRKLETPVDFDHRIHDADDPAFEYRVHALVVHYGTADKGHYVAFGRVGDGWVEYNDGMATRCSSIHITSASVRKNVYILIYKRCRR